MIVISKGTGHKIQAVTDASADVEVHYSIVSKTGTGPASYSYAAAGEPLASITGIATTDIVVGVASTEISIRHLSFYNNHASTSVTLTVQEIDGTDTVTHMKVVLAPGESLVLDAAGYWTHYDANGGAYIATGPFASAADQEAGTSATKVVSPAQQQRHPSALKAWGRFDVAGATTAGYNVDAPTDNGTGDITVNITTDFSGAANYCCTVSVEMTSTTYSVANMRNPHVRNGGLAAGSIRCDCVDQTTITSLIKDPQSWHLQAAGDQ